MQLNLTSDPARGGVADGELEHLVEHVLETPGLRLLGVMAVAPLDEDPRAAFARVRSASERVRRLAPGATAISAGMSQDYVEPPSPKERHTFELARPLPGNDRSTVNLEEKVPFGAATYRPGSHARRFTRRMR